MLGFAGHVASVAAVLSGGDEQAESSIWPRAVDWPLSTAFSVNVFG